MRKKIFVVVLLLAVMLLPTITPAYAKKTEGITTRSHYVQVGESKFNLKDRAVLFVDNNSKEALRIYNSIPDERKPFLITCGNMKDLNMKHYKMPEMMLCPSLVWLEDKEIKGSLFGDAEEELNKLRYPLLVGKASIPNALQLGSSCHNAKMAALQINGAIVMPGEEFSFYDYVLPSKENGYQEGKTLYVTEEGPQWLPDIGGGICKTATVLNFAVKNSGLPVTELHHHTEPVSYAPPGEDASVTRSGGWDYKFINNKTKPIKIVAKQQHDLLLIFEIYEILPEQVPSQSL